jgi:CelD/BcsL family acetyltransferase involved in cellulose biosynthesis
MPSRQSGTGQTGDNGEGPACPPVSLTERSAGSVRFEVRSPVDPDEWQAIADGSSSATFFHTPLWFSVFAVGNPATKVSARMYCFEDGTKAVFPLLVRTRAGGLLRVAESSPAGCYGGWVSGDPLTPDHALAITHSIRRSVPYLVWRVNPVDPLSGVLAPFTTTPDTTEILDLRGFADEDSIRAHFRHSARKQINKGARAALVARVSERWDEWEAYYRIYLARMEQWGSATSSRYSSGFFRALFEAKGPKVSLWVVSHEGKLVGGNVNFYQGKHCVEWHAAYDATAHSLGVRDFLVDWIIRDAFRRGFSWYDFNPSGGHEGSRRFKQTFGTTSRPANLIIRRRGIYRLEPARRVLREIRDRGQPPAREQP